MNLEFSTSTRVIFGRGEFKRLGELVSRHGDRALIVTGDKSLTESGEVDRIVRHLRPRAIATRFVPIGVEPTASAVDALTAEARAFRPEVVVAIGGGSVIDGAKLIAMLLANQGDVLEYIDGGERPPKPVSRRALPLIAAPTTAGTGAEVTENAYLRPDDGSPKRCLRAPLMRAEIALVDPLLTAAAPSELTASCGLNALAQLIEAFTSRRAGILTDGLTREGLSLISGALERAHLDPDDLEARESVAMAALLSGMALDNVGLGAIHALTAPIGVLTGAPHSAIAAALLPGVVAANLSVLEGESDANRLQGRVREIARLISGDPEGESRRLVTTLRLLCRTLGIARLDAFGLKAEHFVKILSDCRNASMNTNPVYLDDLKLLEVLKEQIGEGSALDDDPSSIRDEIKTRPC
jgi:alcohol dehydrogenase class IV